MAPISSIEKVLKILIFFAGLILLLTLAAYILKFGHSPSDISNHGADWGVFGDYLGGTIGAVFGSLSFMGVLWTILLTYREQEGQRAQQVKEDIYRIINTISEEIKHIINQRIEYLACLPNGDCNKYEMHYSSIYEILSDKHEEHELLVEKYHNKLRHTATLLTDLKYYLCEYNNIAGNDYVAMHYRKSFFKVAIQLEHLSLLTKEATAYYKLPFGKPFSIGGGLLMTVTPADQPAKNSKLDISKS